MNLPVRIANRLDKHLKGEVTGVPAGAVAVEAIRTTWRSIQSELQTGDDFFPVPRPRTGLDTTSSAVRKVFYISLAEAHAIERVRTELGNMEIGQLHRLAFEAYFEEE